VGGTLVKEFKMGGRLCVPHHRECYLKNLVSNDKLEHFQLKVLIVKILKEAA
jgi:hypothetical protein